MNLNYFILKLVGVSGKLICLLVLSVCCLKTYPQSDTVLLEQVVITSHHPSRYLPGGKQQTFNTDSLAIENLAQSIEEHAPVYFVQYGAPGQLSSINLRGLGANRTSLLWHGMEINSFTLGQTDFSEIATGNGDQINIQYGGVGAMFGNGALGGTVSIENRPYFEKGHSVSLLTGLGSYGSWGSSLGYRFSNKRLSSSTKLFRRQANNNFQYELAGAGHRQQNAAFSHYGLLQDFVYRINKNQLLSIYFWYNKHFREVQPNKNDFTSDEELETENTRIALSWELKANTWLWKLQTGFSDDSQLYDNSELTRLYRWFGSLDSEWEQSKYLTLRFGGNFNYLKPEVDSYQGNSKETRSELYASAIWKRIRNLSLGFSARAPMANGDFKALSPLVSGSYLLYQSESWNLSGNIQFGQSYRLPTLNDLYWQPGGNPDLKAETSQNIEGGLGLIFQNNGLNLELNVAAFRHAVDNWIIWIPGGRGENPDGEVFSFWYPDNIRKVLAYGVEYQQKLKWQLPLPDHSTLLDISGVFNHAENQNSLSPVDRSKGKQLPYTPEHIINGGWQWFYKSWDFGILAQHRSKRYVEANNELPALPGYTLWRISAGKSGKLGSLNWKLQARVNNVFDESYETFENRAMPGRNYQLNIYITYN